MAFLISQVQRTTRHPDLDDLGFVCECGHRTRSQLNGWGQWYFDGESWRDRCEGCGQWWEVTLRASRV